MNTSAVSPGDSKNKWGLIGVILAAIGASVCCIGPLVLLALGVGGAWVGNLAAFDAYRPFFSLITIGFLGFAFYRVYRTPKEACEPGSACATPQGNRFNKVSLWIVTIVALGLLSFPYLAPGLANAGQAYTANNTATETVMLDVSGMTCGGCAITVQTSLTNLDGVARVEVSYDSAQAVVIYDPARVKVADLTNATRQAGYPTTPVK